MTEQVVPDNFSAPCIKIIHCASGDPVSINGKSVGVHQASRCTTSSKSGKCEDAIKANVHQISSMLYLLEEIAEDERNFSFTKHKVMFDATRTLHTEHGRLRCIPDAEYKMWKNTGMCENALLCITLDDVNWRIIASENAEVEDTTVLIGGDIHAAFETYLKAHKEGGKLLEEVKIAVENGERDLIDHREYLFKVFSLLNVPPTLSHDLSKTALVNFCLGRCFHSDGLDVLKEAVSFDDCMALVKFLHLQVENHHPEHGSRPALSVLDMYLDRVSRGVQKTHGWSNAAWHIPERYAPKEYKDDFKRFEKKFECIKLEDPGDIDIPEKLPGASLHISWEDMPLACSSK